MVVICALKHWIPFFTICGVLLLELDNLHVAGKQNMIDIG